MKHITLGIMAAFICNSAFSQSAGRIDSGAMTFGSIADTECDPISYGRNESVELGVIAAKFALNIAAGYATSLLERATATDTKVKVATAPGYFHFWDADSKAWKPNETCIRFWYGMRGNAVGTVNSSAFGSAPEGQEDDWSSLQERWKNLGLIEQPYAYGELRISYSASGNLATIQPVLLFVRTPKEAHSLFRETTNLAISLDIKNVSTNGAIINYILELPRPNKDAIFLRGVSTLGLGSGWYSYPASPADIPKPNEQFSTPFNSIVTFTSTTDGTLFAKAAASAFKSQREEIVAALTPKTETDKNAEKQKVMLAAFDALAGVAEAEKNLNTAEDIDKPKRAVELAKSKYLADRKLIEAGLPPKYTSTAP